MRIAVLGAAAGGGVPQWNCGCQNCRDARGDGAVRRMTQAQLAVTWDDEAWILLGASPDLRVQLERFPPLWPRGLRQSPIAAIALCHGDLDHVLGLLSMRESQPLQLIATARVRRGITEENRWAHALAQAPATWRALAPGWPHPVADMDGRSTGIVMEAIPVPGKVPRHLEAVLQPDPEDTIALRLSDPRGRVLVWAPSLGGPSPALERWAREADALFVDGTFWSSDELVAQGLGTRRAEDMAHWPLGGSRGSLAWLATLRARRYLVHVNNTNPVLRPGTPEAAALDSAGVALAWDGLEVTL